MRSLSSVTELRRSYVCNPGGLRDIFYFIFLLFVARVQSIFGGVNEAHVLSNRKGLARHTVVWDSENLLELFFSFRFSES